jgi:hypothetical protein
LIKWLKVKVTKVGRNSNFFELNEVEGSRVGLEEVEAMQNRSYYTDIPSGPVYNVIFNG